LGSRIPLLLESKKEVPLIVEMTVVVSVDVIAVVVIASVVVAAAVVAAAVVDPESVICDSNMFVSFEEASSSVVEILTGRVVSLEELSTSVEFAVAIVALFRELLLPSVGPCDEVGAPVGAIDELLVELKPPSSSLNSGKATAVDGLAVGIIICARRRGRAAMDAIGSRLFDCLILSLFCYRFVMLDVFNTCKSR